MFACGRGLKSPAQARTLHHERCVHIYRRLNEISTTVATSSAVILSPLSLSSFWLSSRPIRYQAVHSVMMTAELVAPVVRQGYRAVCCCCCLIVGMYTTVEYVSEQVGGDFKPRPSVHTPLHNGRFFSYNVEKQAGLGTRLKHPLIVLLVFAVDHYVIHVAYNTLHLRKILRRLQTANVALNPSKCKTTVKFLGHIIDSSSRSGQYKGYYEMDVPFMTCVDISEWLIS